MLFNPFISKRGSIKIEIRTQIKFVVLVAFSLLFIGCSHDSSTSIPNPVITTIPQSPEHRITTTPPTATFLPVPSVSPTQDTISIWIPPYLPEKIRLAFTLPENYNLTATPEEAEITFKVGENSVQPTIQWIYALVAPFPTITDGISSEALINSWSGNTIPPSNNNPLIMDENTFSVLTEYWGSPDPQAVQILPADELLEYAWSDNPSWAIVPFERLNPHWKVLTIDDQSPIRKDFDPSIYPLTIPFFLTGYSNPQPELFNLPLTNRDADRLTTLAMTGVTAMVRATAFTMQTKGITYPAQDVGPILAEADITHISNEIPFTPDCPYPNPKSKLLVFCSDPSYIDLLKAVGTDIVELTGDHFMDYGPDATLFTLQMYDDLGWNYFGGGANADEARQPILLESNGNKLAFIGCNIGCQVKNEIPCDAIATDNHPGAALCDFNWINHTISSLREDGYQVIFTFQHREYYTYTTVPILEYDFRQVANAGATIVSGSQAHQPHGFSINDDSFIHYGLGNLFFDQYHFCADYACDDAFIDRHVFYAGQHVSTELITIRFADLARPRLMTPEERAHFLNIIFTASGW
jgi:poly-gamma-glutamate synthesis protein (capsule biosynthesis protein)